MTNAEIPSQTLREAYQAIAERRGTDAAALDKESVSESELMAALAYVLGIPLVEPGDLNDTFLSECGALTAELETDALMDYQLVPLWRRGDTLVAISSRPWDATATEALLGYFQQCARVKFVLASPACLRGLFERLKAAEPKRLPSQLLAPSTPVVLPPRARSTKNPASTKTPVSPAIRSVSAQNDQPLLTSEDVTRVVNVLACEIHRLTQQKSQRSL